MKKDKKKKPIFEESMQSVKSDPLGSYTGKPKDKYEKPEQDADDL